MASLEEKMAFLKTVGIELKPDVQIDDLENEISLTDYEIEEFRRDDYEQLLCTLGDEDFSNDVWNFDAECVEGSGSYVRIAQSLAMLSDGNLPLEDIQDEVNNHNSRTGTAWLSFVLRGQAYKWDLKVDSDWVDYTVFSRFVQLHDSQNPSKRFIYYGLGQNGLIAYATPEQLEKLNRQTGLEFIWLT